MRRSAGPAASLFLTVLALQGCGHGTLIGSGPLPTASPIIPSVTNEFAVPTANSQPGGITSAPDGFLYFAEQAAGKIGQVTTGGSFKEFSIATSGGTAGNNAIDVAVGPDGQLWFTEQGAAPGVAAMSLSTDKIKEYPVAGSAPVSISSGAAANTLAFTDPGHDAIGQINTTTGIVTETGIPSAAANPLGIAINSGDALHVYFTEDDASKIGVLNVVSNTIAEIPTLTPAAGPTLIVQGPDGAMWFTENNVAKMGHLTLSGQLTEFPLSPATSATGLVTARDNNVYFGDPVQNKIGSISGITPATVTEYAIPTANALPGRMTLGPDGRVYFTEVDGNKIGQLNY